MASFALPFAPSAHIALSLPDLFLQFMDMVSDL